MTRRNPNIQEHPEAAPPVRKHRNSSGLGTGWEGTGGSETSRVALGMDGMEGSRSLLDTGEGKTAAEPGVPVVYLLQVQAVDLCQPPELPDARDVLPVQADGGGGQQPRGSGGTWQGFFWGCPEPPFPPAQALRGHPSPEPGGHEAVTEGGSRGCLLRGCGNSE